jgi:hypothetical protein
MSKDDTGPATRAMGKGFRQFNDVHDVIQLDDLLLLGLR